MDSGDRFIRLPEVLSLVAVSRAQLYRLVALGEFPKQVKLGARSVAWLESEISAWMVERVRQRDN